MNDTTPAATAATEAETTSTKRVAVPPELVVMTDGRTVEFTGRTRLDKTILIDGDSVAVRFDFRNGQTATYPIPPQHMLYAAGHGWSQKLGDHVAGMKDEKTKEPATEEDMFLAIESLVKDMESGWNKVRTGEGTVSGAASSCGHWPCTSASRSQRSRKSSRAVSRRTRLAAAPLPGRRSTPASATPTPSWVS